MLGRSAHARQCGLEATLTAGYNIRWLMRAIARLAKKRPLLAPPDLAPYARFSVWRSASAARRALEVVAAALGYHAGIDARSPRPAPQINWGAD